MKNRAKFLNCMNESETGNKITPEFLLLYQQSILLALKEQGVINQMLYELCLEALAGQF